MGFEPWLTPGYQKKEPTHNIEPWLMPAKKEPTVGIEPWLVAGIPQAKLMNLLINPQD